MALKKRVGVFETYDRARTGPRMDEKEWDMRLTNRIASKLKEKYKLQFDRSKIIPITADVQSKTIYLRRFLHQLM